MQENQHNIIFWKNKNTYLAKTCSLILLERVDGLQY